MTRVAWFGDSAESGFGLVTRELVSRLLHLGDDVRMFNRNVDGEPTPLAERIWDINRLQPKHMEAMLDGHLRDNWQPQVVMLLADYHLAVHIVAGFGDALREAFYRLPVLHYVPIEGRGIPNAWGEFWRYVMPVAMSEFGADQLERVTGRRPPVIYHGVDTRIFRPVSFSHPIILPNGRMKSKEECKMDVGLDPSHVILLRTDRHMPRKRYNALIRSLSPLLEARKNVDLVIHCKAQDEGGILQDTIRKLPQDARRHVMLTHGHDTWRGLAPEKLAELYNAADIYVSAGAEGFGLTLAEAVACGVPAVGIDYSSVPEVIGPAGRLIPIAHECDNTYDHYWACPDEDALLRTVTELVDDPKERKRLGALGPAHVRTHFDWDTVSRQFHALLRRMAG